ncbi:MAG: glycosyltransferase family 2 protein [Puniceicoccaceae bacterium]
MMISPIFSVVTSVYNGIGYTRVFMETLRETTERLIGDGQLEIVAIDDGSDDGSLEYLRNLDLPITVLRNDDNRGFAFSNNRGVSEARGEWIFFLNNDLILEPGWWEPMIEVAETRDGCGMVGNVQRRADNQRVDHVGINFDYLGVPVHEGKNALFIREKGVRRSRGVTAACALVRRRSFIRAGGFDEGFRNGFEDIDLCLRMAEQGFEHLVARSSLVAHHVSVSEGRKDHEDLNRLRFLKRWSKKTREFGRRDWACWYIQSQLRSPWLFNGPKLLDAMGLATGLRRTWPSWIRERQQAADERIRILPEAGEPFNSFGFGGN